MASIFRDPTTMTFVDEDNRELRSLTDMTVIPRVGENVRLSGVPYVVDRIGYDIPERSVTHIWVVCRPA